MQQRVTRLLLRLELGIQGPMVDFARHARRTLDRADYRRLCKAGMTALEALAESEDSTLLPLLGNDPRKIARVRDAVERWRESRHPAPPPALSEYQP